MFSWRHFQASFLTASSISFWLYTFYLLLVAFLLITCSSKHFIHKGFKKIIHKDIIPLYLIMVSLMAFLRSYLDIKFWWGIFNCFASRSIFDIVLNYFLQKQPPFSVDNNHITKISKWTYQIAKTTISYLPNCINPSFLNFSLSFLSCSGVRQSHHLYGCHPTHNNCIYLLFWCLALLQPLYHSSSLLWMQ